MELYQLNTFVVVAEEGHLTRASERLHASQSTVSAHVRALEEELDTVLFIRTPKGMRLTEAGRRLKPRAERVLAAARDLSQEARSLNENLTGDVRIGLNTDAEFLRVVPLVAFLSEAHPGITPQLVQTSSSPLQDEIRAGRIDCGFMFGIPRHPDLSTIRLERSQFCVAVHENWKGHIESGIAGLSRLPWIKEPSDCPAQLLFDEFFASHGVTPMSVLEVDGDEVIRVLVASGKALAFLRPNEIEAANRIGGPVHGVAFEGLSLDLSFVMLGRNARDPVMRAVASQVRKVWEVSKEAITASDGSHPW